MLSVAEARARIIAALPVMSAETVALTAAAGRILADDVAARRTQPPFDVSAMDGWACRQNDLATMPAVLRPIGSAAAGGRHEGRIGPGDCVRIFTGAPIPDGADAIVIQEDADLGPDGHLVVREAPKTGQWIRKAGLDFADGQVLLKAGTALSPSDIGLAAAMNVPWLTVRRKPRIAVLATGDELARPGEPIGPNQIVSSNNIALCALIETHGSVAIDLGIARDTETDLRAKAAAAAGCDLLLTLGGASVGEHDLIHKILGGGGAGIDFWKIAMRPGKPLMFGRADLGTAGSVPLLGLPGNPVSALVCGYNFLLPALRAMLGLGWDVRFDTAVTGSDLVENDRREDYLRSTLERRTDGALIATAFARQDSSMLRRLSEADCLIVRPPLAPAIKAGSAVPILRLR
jgi:molybdopterin molybdotransferase